MSCVASGATLQDRIRSEETEDADLHEYVANRTLVGLFTYIAIEEEKVRTDPVARLLCFHMASPSLTTVRPSDWPASMASKRS